MSEFWLHVLAVMPGCALAYWLGYRAGKSDAKPKMTVTTEILGGRYVWWIDSDGMRHYESVTTDE